MSEICPTQENRVTIDKKGNPIVAFQTNNLTTKKNLRSIFKKIFRKAGYWSVISYGVEKPWHLSGSLCFGNDPKTSVLNKWNKMHDVENLYVVDSCFLPSVGAMNTSLTIMAQALRVGDHINEELNKMPS